MRSFVILLILFFLFSFHASAEEDKPHIYGNFLQLWLCSDWEEEQWDQEFKAMASLGMKAVIVGDLAVRKPKESYWTTYYPSELPDTKMFADNLEPLFRYAEKYGFQLYLGLGNDSEWWNWNLSNEKDAKKFYNVMRQSVRFAQELNGLYKSRYSKVLGGFYCACEIWNHEDWNQKYLREIQAERMAKGFNIVIKALNEFAPELPLFFSPFSTAKNFASLENTEAFYESFLKKTNFREADAMLPMDSIGTGGQTLETVDAWSKMYMSAVKNSGSQLNCYVNVESFIEPSKDRMDDTSNTPLYGINYWGSAPISRYIRQLEIAQKYSPRIFTFSFTHYHSPVTNIPGFYNGLLKYYQTGEKDVEFPIAPSTVFFMMKKAADRTKRKETTLLKITWIGASDNFGISCVNLYKENKIVAYRTAMRRENRNSAISEPPFIFYPEYQADGKDYQLGFVDVWGNETLTKPFKINLLKGQVNF